MILHVCEQAEDADRLGVTAGAEAYTGTESITDLAGFATLNAAQHQADTGDFFRKKAAQVENDGLAGFDLVVTVATGQTQSGLSRAPNASLRLIKQVRAARRGYADAVVVIGVSVRPQAGVGRSGEVPGVGGIGCGWNCRDRHKKQ